MLISGRAAVLTLGFKGQFAPEEITIDLLVLANSSQYENGASRMNAAGNVI